jgi:copper chaperone CopZ
VTSMTKKTYRIEGMECANCAMRIEGIEDAIPGVWRVEASYHKARMVIEFDEALVGEVEIIRAVEVIGYRAIAAED